MLSYLQSFHRQTKIISVEYNCKNPEYICTVACSNVKLLIKYSKISKQTVKVIQLVGSDVGKGVGILDGE